MTVEKKVFPAEIMVRWREGVVTGAHVAEEELIYEDGKLIAGKAGAAIPISLAGDFPLEKWFPDVQSGALKAVEQLKTEKEEQRSAHEKAMTEVQEEYGKLHLAFAELEGKHRHALAHISALEALIDSAVRLAREQQGVAEATPEGAAAVGNPSGA
jgi:hypothetical protein